MKRREVIMGMPIEIEIVGAAHADLDPFFAYLREVDERFSTYKETSEISEINRGERELTLISHLMREVFDLAERTKNETHGYFDMRRPDGTIDPSGIVKGWAVKNTAQRIESAGYDRYAVNAGGDIASHGRDEEGGEWRFGIRNPFQHDEIVKVIVPKGKGVATSGSYARGDHIYNPHAPTNPIRDVVSITVIGPDVLEADRFATAAFAMGKEGVAFIESLMGFEAYQISRDGVATFTNRFEEYTII